MVGDPRDLQECDSHPERWPGRVSDSRSQRPHQQAAQADDQILSFQSFYEYSKYSSYLNLFFIRIRNIRIIFEIHYKNY